MTEYEVHSLNAERAADSFGLQETAGSVRTPRP